MSIYSSLKSSGASSAGTTLSLTAPTSPSDGTLWFDTSDSTLYIRTGNVWLEAVSTAAGAAGVAGASANPLPVGNIAQRPGSPVAGSMRINSETNYFETYYNSNWFNLTYIGLVTATSANATVTYSGNYAIHTFLTSGVFTPTSVPVGGTVEYLIVAGGGGGGGGPNVAGGGGAGGVLTGSVAVSLSAITVTVGAGGTIAQNGFNSVFNGITSTGGGYGGSEGSSVGSNGGSGGGATYAFNTAGTGIVGQGTNGGLAGSSGNGFPSGGGGGATVAGSAGVNSVRAGAGGTGYLSAINGTASYYGGGGGGGGWLGISTYAPGGSGGGGAGSYNGQTVFVSASGTPNTGGGGGGGYTSALSPTAGGSGAGGSGIVIIRYRYQ